MAPRLLEEPAIARERARIAIEVPARLELQPVHEDRSDDAFPVAMRDVDERDVAGVEVSHGGDEGDGRLALQAFAQLGDGVDYVQMCSGPGYVLAFTAFTYASIAAFTDGAPSMKFFTKRAFLPG